ncbi:PAS domain-containing sensor histidine kinase [Pontibacillus sp. HMF3514]|uniref:PAS domain-containing sensor histidine kinase n=1 Tax=Pontibacillus sp. HMF3514 TaxID=2692425 RepID=UPI00131F5EB9|nr:PAS domain-containing sensor histidine kinase [Pontibacillus sp. HMF3514]QHE51018.1 PAS domain S-box protein [Pontibacillus sp. HMF3514]
MVFQKEQLDNKMTVEDCFEMLDFAGKWGCYINHNRNRVLCNKSFTKMVNSEGELTVCDWLSFFSKKDQSILKVRVENPINQEDFYVRVQINQQHSNWVKTSLKIVQEGVFIIGDVPVPDHNIIDHDINEPVQQKQNYVNQNVDHFMTWLSLIDQEMVSTKPKMDPQVDALERFKGDQHIQTIMEEIPHGFSVLGDDWKIRYMNPTLEKIVGRRLDDLYQKNVWTVYPVEQYQDMYSKLKEAFETQEVMKIEQYVSDIGKTLELTVFPNGDEMTLFIQDLTEVRLYTRALQETEERFSLLAENINEVFWITTSDFETWEYMSPSFEKIFEMSIEEAYKDKDLWFQGVHEEDRDEVHSAFLFMRYQKVAVEYRFQMKNGDWKWIRSKGYPLQKGDKSIVVGVHEDITNLKEKDELQARTKQNETALRVAAGIAHEIRNPLTSIKGFMQLMMSNKMEVQKYSGIIFSELSRIETIVNEFMLLAKPTQKIELEETDVHDIMIYVTSLFKNQIEGQDIELIQNLDPSLPQCLSDPKRLKQIFINLVKNAVEAMEGGGSLTVKSEYIKQNSSLRFTVSDTGKGIEQEKLQRIGEPFFTTKEKGTGLGVMVTNKFVESLDGQIHYESEIGKGTSVIVTLPIKPI